MIRSDIKAPFAFTQSVICRTSAIVKAVKTLHESRSDQLPDLGLQIGPAVEKARGEIGEDQQLNLDLEESPRRVAGLDVDNGQLVGKGLALVVGIDNLDLGDRSG